MKTTLYFTITLLTIVMLISASNSFGQQAVGIPEPALPPVAVQRAFNLDPFYQQWIDVEGFPVLASAKVNPYAVKEAAWLIEQMIGHRPDVLRAMAGNKARFSVIAHTEIITEIPEYRSDARPDFLVFRERGWGGTEGATVTSSEENILSYPGGGTYNVMIHEFAHGIHLLGLNTLDPTFDERLRRTYEAAMQKGLWSGTYASSDRREYWAEASQAYFNPNTPGSFSRFGNTRQALKRYDPGIAALRTEIYGDRNYRYTHIKTRLHLPHLHGFDPQNSPMFQGFPELAALYEQLRTDPTSDGGGKWVNLEPHPPAQLARLTQANPLGTASTIIFVNFTQTDVLLYWVGSDRREGYWTRVPPGYVRGTPSEINRVWVVKNQRGQNIAVFQTEAKAGRAAIGTPRPKVASIRTEAKAGRAAISTPPSKVASIRDPNLANAVRKVLGLRNNASITHQDMLKLNELDARNSGIKNLTGLEHATRLTRLNLDRNQIRNLNPLSGLTHLKTLTLDENQISDIRPLTELTQLEWLLIGGNPIKNADVRLLAELKQLKGLSLYANKISNIKPLATLKKLEALWLDNNQIRDVSPLAGLVNLKTLKLSGNPIQDASVLASLTNLREVDIDISRSPVVHVESGDYPPLYWVDETTGTLHRLVGDTVENLASTVKNVTGLAVDTASGKLYWTEKTGERTGRIRRSNLDGTDVKLVKNLTSVPYDIALDTANGKLYVTNSWGKIQRLNLDGSNFQPNLITDLKRPRHLVLDVANNKLYWTEKTSPTTGRIRSAHLNGTNLQLVKDFQTSVPLDITLDATNGKLYWTNPWGEVHRMNVDGSGIHPNFIKGLTTPTDIAVDIAGQKFYVTSADGKISRRHLSSGGLQEVVTGLGTPGGLVLGGIPPAAVESVAPPATSDRAADVNEDKKVNKADLLLVVTALGEKPPANPNLDVNADGVVNIADVLLVIEALDDPVVAAAPSLGAIGASLDPGLLRTQIDILRAESDGSLKYEHAIAYFQSLLASIRPAETRLLANYPNPFNPETWIPYQLAASGEVTVRIYDVNGGLVRTLALEHQPVGRYESRSRAAYWDGRNALGEPVASGVYFYTLTAGNFAQTRRMLILK